MRWLLKLFVPPGGVVIEPFLGSGTTAMACALEGYQCVAIEEREKWVVTSVARTAAVLAELGQNEFVTPEMQAITAFVTGTPHKGE